MNKQPLCHLSDDNTAAAVDITPRFFCLGAGSRTNKQTNKKTKQNNKKQKQNKQTNKQTNKTECQREIELQVFINNANS